MIDWKQGITLGMPATIHCGTDSYEAEVVELIDYKTREAWERAGHWIKAVVVEYKGNGGLNGRRITFRIKHTPQGDYLYIPKARAFGLTLGEAYSYQDPHF
jgi:hypothetical protein